MPTLDKFVTGYRFVKYMAGMWYDIVFRTPFKAYYSDWFWDCLCGSMEDTDI